MALSYLYRYHHGVAKRIDPFTKKRAEKFVTDFRAKSGQLPTLRDFEDAGFDRDFVDTAVKEKWLEPFYVTLTNGTIVKGFKKV